MNDAEKRERQSAQRQPLRFALATPARKHLNAGGAK